MHNRGMPRSNRYIEPGHTYHVTHRCHDRAFLFRFAIDRQAYRKMMRERLPVYGIRLLNYCLTSNHTHLLLRVRDGTVDSLSRFMQSLEGDFAQAYNARKKRSGAFWSDRYHCVMIQNGRHLRRCMAYIDLNMVRAGVVGHPEEWEWTGYRELMGMRLRNRLIDMETLCRALGQDDTDLFRTRHQAAIEEALNRRELLRQAWWTESIAVGDEGWVRQVSRTIRNRLEVKVEAAEDEASVWRVMEARPTYGAMDGFTPP